MVSELFFCQLALIVLVWLCLMLCGLWPEQRVAEPLCEDCERGAAARPKALGAPPPLLVFSRGRRRTIDTQQQFCADQDCAYYDWTGRGNIRANGHPGSKRWRQLQCVSCHGYFQQTHLSDAPLSTAPQRSVSIFPAPLKSCGQAVKRTPMSRA